MSTFIRNTELLCVKPHTQTWGTKADGYDCPAIRECMVAVGEWSMEYDRYVHTEMAPSGGWQPCGWGGGLRSP